MKIDEFVAVARSYIASFGDDMCFFEHVKASDLPFDVWLDAFAAWHEATCRLREKKVSNETT